MRVLVDIVHPADVLFFLNPIRTLLERGDDVLIASRSKDVACDLLDKFGLEHRPLSVAGSGRLGLLSELFRRDIAMLGAIARFRPQVLVGLGGVSIAHAGWLTRRPAISFYAADTANLQTRITWPFITHVFVPKHYAGKTPHGRTSRFSGVKELSYFHPDSFSVSEDLGRANGWDQTRDNFLIRTVSWSANHDLGKSGWDEQTLRKLVQKLSERGKVHISSERRLPADLVPFSYRGRSDQLHHLMAQCRLYVGESATMAHEACLLGVPAIYDGADHPGTTRSLQQYGLLTALRQPGSCILLEEVERMLDAATVTAVRQRRDAYFAQHGSLSRYIVDAIDRFALPS